MLTCSSITLLQVILTVICCIDRVKKVALVYPVAASIIVTLMVSIFFSPANVLLSDNK